VTSNDSNLDAMIAIASRSISTRISRMDRARDHSSTDRWIHCAECVTSGVLGGVMCCGMDRRFTRVSR
jgi:hypothetical protein